MIARTLVATGLLSAGLAAGWRWIGEPARLEAAVHRELQLQTPELVECEARLRSIHGAWQRYREEHAAEPPSFEALIPAYLHRPEHLECPTARRRREERRPLTDASLRVGNRIFHVSYGFRWLVAGDPLERRRLGRKAPLAVCEAHRESAYLAAFGRLPRMGVASAPPTELPAAVARAPVPAVLRDGQMRTGLSP